MLNVVVGVRHPVTVFALHRIDPIGRALELIAQYDLPMSVDLILTDDVQIEMIVSTISPVAVVVALKSQSSKAPNAELVVEHGFLAGQLNIERAAAASEGINVGRQLGDRLLFEHFSLLVDWFVLVELTEAMHQTDLLEVVTKFFFERLDDVLLFRRHEFHLANAVISDQCQLESGEGRAGSDLIFVPRHLARGDELIDRSVNPTVHRNPVEHAGLRRHVHFGRLNPVINDRQLRGVNFLSRKGRGKRHAHRRRRQ